jgi:hypothetical protein
MRPLAWSGQFVVIDWPFTDRSSSKRRPALAMAERTPDFDPIPESLQFHDRALYFKVTVLKTKC